MDGRLILLRHGESVANAVRRFTESDRVPLTPLGREQARRGAALIEARFQTARLFSSPFARARETADIVGARLGQPVEVEPDVREQHLGRLHGRPYDAALEHLAAENATRWAWRPPGGETLLEVQKRALRALLRIAAEEPASDTVVASHGGTIGSIWAYAVGAWDAVGRLPNCAILVVPHDGARLGTPELLED